MTNRQKVDKILECYRLIKEDAAAAAPGMSVGGGGIAGMPPEDTDPPVDYRRKKYKKLNMFYRQAVKPSKGAKNARKGT